MPFAATNLNRLRCAALFAAILLYGLLGTPTPDDFGWVEMTVGALLVFASGVHVIVSLFLFTPETPAWQKAGTGFLFFGLSIPLLIGIFSGNDPRLVLRDVVPFLFLLLPVFLAQPFTKEPDLRRTLTFCTAAAGVAFAARVVLPFFVAKGGWAMEAPADPSYMANAPTVLFAALLLTGLSGQALYTSIKGRSLAASFFFLLCSLLPLAAMTLIVQRAHLGMVVIGLGFLLSTAIIRSPLRAARLLLLIVICSIFAFPFAQQAGFHVLTKTESVGFNMRFEEAAAVLNALGDSPLSVLFGHGWGATVASPAVGGVTVNFTHSLLTTYLLKTGLTGLGFVLAYLGFIASRLPVILPRDVVIAVALAAPLIVDVLLYASFKSLDFGLILLLIAVWGQKRRDH